MIKEQIEKKTIWKLNSVGTNTVIRNRLIESNLKLQVGGERRANLAKNRTEYTKAII